jgi:hypothetical protein
LALVAAPLPAPLPASTGAAHDEAKEPPRATSPPPPPPQEAQAQGQLLSRASPSRTPRSSSGSGSGKARRALVHLRAAATAALDAAEAATAVLGVASESSRCLRSCTCYSCTLRRHMGKPLSRKALKTRGAAVLAANAAASPSLSAASASSAAFSFSSKGGPRKAPDAGRGLPAPHAPDTPRAEARREEAPPPVSPSPREPSASAPRGDRDKDAENRRRSARFSAGPAPAAVPPSLVDLTALPSYENMLLQRHNIKPPPPHPPGPAPLGPGRPAEKAARRRSHGPRLAAGAGLGRGSSAEDAHVQRVRSASPSQRSQSPPALAPARRSMSPGALAKAGRAAREEVCAFFFF